MDYNRFLGLTFLIIWLMGAVMLLGPQALAQNAEGTKLEYGYTANGDGIIEPGEIPEEELAKASQNPVADLISLPLQNNTSFEFGPREKTQNVLNIQPVIPFHITSEWNLITRTIIPVISQPAFTRDQDREDGLGDINTTTFFSPAKPSKLIWGVGPIFVFPSATDERLGTEKWSAGPSAVALTIHGPWVAGVLAFHLVRYLGPGKASEIFLSGQPLSASEAQQLGLITTVVSEDELEQRCLEKLEELSAFPSIALSTTRRMIRPEPAEIELFLKRSFDRV